MNVLDLNSRVVIKPGDKLLFRPTPHKRSAEQKKFLEEPAHKPGIPLEFVGFVEEWALPLDSAGRVPGVYAVQNTLRVRTSSRVWEISQRDVQAVHTPRGSELAWAETHGPIRLRDLPRSIRYYPDDVVQVHGVSGLLPEAARRVLAVVREPGTELLKYRVEETNVELQHRFKTELAAAVEKRTLPSREVMTKQRWDLGEEAIVLSSQGPIGFLYADKANKFSHFDPAVEIERVWRREGVSHMVKGWLTRDEAQTLFNSGAVDVVAPSRLNSTDDERYSAYVLHDQFRKHRERVRNLTGLHLPVSSA